MFCLFLYGCYCTKEMENKFYFNRKKQITLVLKSYKFEQKLLNQSQESASQENKATLLRKREVALARISIYIVFVFLLCHSVRIVPNTYEMITTYTEVNIKRLNRGCS